MHLNWILISAVYIIIVIAVCLRIVYDTRSSTKTIAYLLLSILVPVAGILFYLVFGVNYWKLKLYNKKSAEGKKILDKLEKEWEIPTAEFLKKSGYVLEGNYELAAMLLKELHTPLSGGNKVKILVNGEEKFPEVLTALKEAKHHIHLEYYIYENDSIGKEIENILIAKAKEGIQVKFIYDDFGSPSINKKMEIRLKEAGVEVYPFQKVLFYLLANRLNYRNHRKIIVIDGQTAFTGGINVSDKYINNKPGRLYWRDTHIRIDGPGVFYLQYLFFTDWNFCCGKKIKPSFEHFVAGKTFPENTFLQVVASGPDADQPAILFSILQAINLATKEILITSPYLIPGDTILDALKVAALSGLSVKLLVPGISDSKLVNAASRSYYGELLFAGIDIYLYNKGFVHAKTMVTDGKFSVIGTANMDMRSFELNFEVNVLLYDEKISKKLRSIFFEDLKDAKKIDAKKWNKRPVYKQLPEKLARLFSPVM
ncbi:cardiolipin synthase [Ginsengibacter hankyongi]|uniref:Cardiolipin synthase n=1 Tax=Ginsengibacter hankyongi TaxID=2607284 RepID=A0A5J5IKE6_9BACT|nr:cardiolipin synthase [Ginsengibacter hankyongi]KAA9039489.1 cardiolipin synthase [Ginsengibacter hankyongi]